MLLEFKIFELKETSKMYQQLIIKAKKPNEFIIVGEDEELDCYKVQQICENSFSLIDGLTIDEFSFLIKKDDLKIKTDGLATIMQGFDIPKKYLTVDIIENIQRLNA